jgi:hypothetical protein
MQIKIHQPQLLETQEPAQMNNGGDVELEAFMRNNPMVAEMISNGGASDSTDDNSTIPYTNTAQPTNFGDAYAVWLQSKPEAPPKVRGMGQASKLVKARNKKYKQDLAAWQASEPDFATFTASQQQQQEEPCRS